MATVLYFRNSGSSEISRGLNDTDKTGSAQPWKAFALMQTFGTGSNTSVIHRTLAGPTVGQTIGTGSVKYEWLSPPIKKIKGGSYVNQGIVTQSSPEYYERFGNSVAYGTDSDTMVIGIPQVDDANNRNGKVHIYSAKIVNFPLLKILTASNGAANDEFGTSVATSQNGTIVVVGAPIASSSRGKAYIYSGSTWNTERILTASDQTTNDQFGTSVACSADGNIVIVGAPYAAAGGTSRGKVYIYSGSNWSIQQTLTASDAANNANFGYDVACSADGRTIVVGAYGAVSGAIAPGKVYVYSGSNWSTQYIITSSDRANNDSFGKSVACSVDGRTIMVGAPGKNTEVGKVYIYSGSNWSVELGIDGSTYVGGQNYSSFGSSVACSPDASEIFIAAGGYDDLEVPFADIGLIIMLGAPRYSSTILNVSAVGGNSNCAFGLSGSRFLLGYPGYDISVEQPYPYPPLVVTEAGIVYLYDRDDNRIRGTVQMNLYASEASASTNATIGVRVEIVDNTGSIKFPVVDSIRGTELQTTNDVIRTWSATPVSRSVIIIPGDRIRATVYVDDETGGTTLAGSSSVTFHYDGLKTNLGDSNISFTEPIVFMQSPLTDKETILTASDGIYGDYFGQTVACSTTGDIVVVGTGANPNKMYIYSGSNWVTEKIIQESQNSSTTVACSANGRTIVAGTYSTERVYIYTGSNWQTSTIVTASDSASNDYFGYSVACSSDGRILVVGSPYRDNSTSGYTDSGRVHIFSGSNWEYVKVLQPVDAGNGGNTGYSVACSADASTIVIGAIGYSLGRGLVFVYTGSGWSQSTILTASDQAQANYFGSSVACSSDGRMIFVGAPNQPGDGVTLVQLGKVYMFSGSNWAIETQISASDYGLDNASYAYFGTSLACSADGQTLVVGAYRAGYNSDGVTYGTRTGKVYVYSGSNWKREIKTYIGSDSEPSDRFGNSVACSVNASRIVVGAPWALGNYNSSTSQGKVYVYEAQNTGSQTITYLTSESVSVGTNGRLAWTSRGTG